MYFQEAYTNLIATKLRTLLAMIGILVGTASVVAMVSSGELATAAALEQFKTLGTDMLSASILTQQDSSSSSSSQSHGQELTVASAVKVQAVSPQITMVAPYTMLFVPVMFAGNNINAGLIGATQTLAPAIGIKMLQGRFISDLDKYAYFCVLGYQVFQSLNIPAFINPLGLQIKLGTDVFTIIGIADQWKENSFFNQDINNSIIIPIQTAKSLSKYSTIDNLVFRLQENADIEVVKDAITKYINLTVPGKKLFFHSAKEIIKSVLAQRKIFTLLLGLIGSISLLVGGIGVMNIMLVSVLERRREIGIRLALGARRIDIQWMFLSEAILLSVVGGLLGILVGVGTSFLIAQFAGWSFQVFLWPPLVGFSVSLLIGVFFGFYPAHQASLLDPIQTLRSE